VPFTIGPLKVGFKWASERGLCVAGRPGTHGRVASLSRSFAAIPKASSLHFRSASYCRICL